LQTCSGRKNVTEQVANLLRQKKRYGAGCKPAPAEKRYGAGCKPAPAENVTEQVANLLRQKKIVWVPRILRFSRRKTTAIVSVTNSFVGVSFFIIGKLLF
jgi:hypothetical protein